MPYWLDTEWHTKIYYEEYGAGEPLLLLHDNGFSSIMNEAVLPYYEKNWRIIHMDLPGYGKSGRIAPLPTNFWYEQAMLIIRLLKKQYPQINIIGTGGGALIALNMALEEPAWVKKVVADSFQGDKAFREVAYTIEEERKISKQMPEVVALWEYCHGADWEAVIDQDTQMVIRHCETVKNYFLKPLETLLTPVLITYSKDDGYSEKLHLEEIYERMQKQIKNSQLYAFATGSPAFYTAEAHFASVATYFLQQTS